MKYYNYTNKLLKLSKQFKKTASELYKFADIRDEEYALMADGDNILRMKDFGTSMKGVMDSYRRVAAMRAQEDAKKVADLTKEKYNSCPSYPPYIF